MHQLLDPKEYQFYSSNLVSIYNDFISDLREDSEADYENRYLSNFFQELFKEIVKSRELNDYHPLSFYWVFIVDKLITIIQLLEEFEESSNEELYDEIFFFWESSEYTEIFLKEMADSNEISATSKKLIQLIENQIITFFYLNISKEHKFFEESIPYTISEEFGDFAHRVYLRDNSYISFPEEVQGLPSLLIQSVASDKIEIEDDFGLMEISVEENKHIIELSELSLQIRPSCSNGINTINEISEKIKKAISIIKEGSPNLIPILSSFSNVIVPVNEPGIVSYSMENLPGFSIINTFERDLIDLVDDLIHENGHHYLNSILHEKELINEDDDKIFFSPWRKALRPIRGIYHGHLTFYWAFELFKNLLNYDSENISKNDKDKIRYRYLEEFLMLKFSEPMLEKAYKMDKLTEEGYLLFSKTSELINLKESFEEEVNQLSGPKKEDILKLKKYLQEMKERFPV